MSVVEPCLIRFYDAAGGLVVWVVVPLADDYLAFLAGRAGRNTVLVAGYDLRMFFAAVGIRAPYPHRTQLERSAPGPKALAKLAVLTPVELTVTSRPRTIARVNGTSE